MSVTFRNASYHKKVTWGKRTVKEGECAAVWNLSGEYRVVQGPKREWLFCSRVRFMDRHVADEHQYLVVQYTDGRKEHLRGPISLFEDPVRYQSIRVENAVKVDAFEVIVVYTEDAKGSVDRTIVKGPTVFIPTTNQWIHTFSWHGNPNSTKTDGAKQPGMLNFTKLRTIPDQFYYCVNDVRTADDALLSVNVMIFFQLENLEKMLDSTHDPIGDFVNAVSADLMNHGAQHSYEDFIQNGHKLSEITAYPVLTQRAESVGYQINKVVYRGYTSTNQLQSMQDAAIKSRTTRRLAAEEQTQQQELLDMELKRTMARLEQEHSQAAEEKSHQLQLDELEHKQKLKQQQEAHNEKLKQKQDETNLELAMIQKRNEVQTAFLNNLKAQGVDLTKYLCAQNNPVPEKVIQVVSEGNNFPRGLGLNV
eukprot:TRINITY_DN21173_c0_g1_i1.p1 TRINITY_DN21173_c0_g1~~TRINITY_DN21173_c0_g1_i1.p1  ORF type:complete len:421 (-),score=66.87 TRINITY_DN21173_c0_g1_i1:152-1414(-)